MAQIESELIKAYEAAQAQELDLIKAKVENAQKRRESEFNHLVTQRLGIWGLCGIDLSFADEGGILRLPSSTLVFDNFNAVDNVVSFYIRIRINSDKILDDLHDAREYIDQYVTRGGACFGGHYLYEFLAQDALTFLNKTAALDDKQYISLNRLSGVAPARELLRATLGAMIHNLKEAASNFDAVLSEFEAAAERAEKAYAEKQARIRELEERAHHAD